MRRMRWTGAPRVVVRRRRPLGACVLVRDGPHADAPRRVLVRLAMPGVLRAVCATRDVRCKAIWRTGPMNDNRDLRCDRTGHVFRAGERACMCREQYIDVPFPVLTDERAVAETEPAHGGPTT